MCILFLVFFANVVHGLILPSPDNLFTENVDESGKIVSIWASGAFEWFMKQNCTEQGNLIEETCLLMKLTPKYNYRIYGVEPLMNKKIGTIFPDGDSKHKNFHDGIVVLDPFPAARFGHPILVFHVDLMVRKSDCDTLKGFLIDSKYCLQPLSRSHCNRHAFNYRAKLLSVVGPNCGEVVFLPLVHLQGDLPVQSNDQLHCFANIEGFNRTCPQLRSKSETNRVSCDPLLTNRDCGFLENSLNSRCSNYETCDHAILLSGGWNRQLSDVSTYDNIMNVKRLLLMQGFSEDNVVVFYANGQEEPTKSTSQDDASFKSANGQDDSSDEEVGTYYSSSLKTTMRNHITTLCESEYCSDTLFIYMNSPTKPDGSSLLWDVFDNGVYDLREIYTARELMRDISHCKANRVVVLADQSYGGALVSEAEARSFSLQNVIIFTSVDEYNYGTAKDRLTRQFLREKYTCNDICLSEFRNTFNHMYKAPEFIGEKPNLLNNTLVGGPCTGKSTSLNDPSAYKYRGCSLSPIV